jgi:hypoxanthine-DNA glycosylase
MHIYMDQCSNTGVVWWFANFLLVSQFDRRCQINQNINQFWKLLGVLLGEDLYSLPYAERLPRLFAHRFGLWDVLAACEREGSLDSAIRKPAANDFERLHRLCPELQTVGFNGQASGKFAAQFAQHGYRTVVLPSSSPAHMSLSFEQKLAHWRALLA